MNSGRILYHLVRADFLERTRRYSFLVTLGLVLWLAYLSVSGQFRMTMGTGYAGIIDSAWVGSTMALSISFLLGLLGFYLVKGSVARDYTTGVGQIMATTPMSGHLYLLGKWLSNCAVLAITALIVAAAGFVMQLWLGQGDLDVGALLVPPLLIGLPWLGLVAALAVFFESITWLRGGMGNILYIVLFFSLIIFAYQPLTQWTPAFVVNPYADLAGIQTIGDSVSRSLDALYPGSAGFSFGILGITDLQLFPYSGIHWTPALLFARLLLLLLAMGLVLLSGLLFDRFDPARPLPARRRRAAPEPIPAPIAEPIPLATVQLTPLAGQASHFRFRPLLVGELRLFLKGQRWWWYAVALGLIVAQLATPPALRPYLLIAAWVWPILLLSGLGCREKQFDTRQLVFSAPRPMSQLPAAWLCAVLVMAVLGSGALLGPLLAADLVAILGWLTAIVFVPSLALALGTLTGSGKAFEVIYVCWMYALLEQVQAIDFAGLAPGSHFYLYGLAAIGLLTLAALARRRQLQVS